MSETPITDQDPDLMGGAMVFYGTRVMVETLIDYLTEGDTIDAFLDDFPTVSREQVIAFLERMSVRAADENSD